ncbi:unnamed protein product, partial [marine sediment metagenome]
MKMYFEEQEKRKQLEKKIFKEDYDSITKDDSILSFCGLLCGSVFFIFAPLILGLLDAISSRMTDPWGSESSFIEQLITP